jgi:hypothetical protein
MFDSLILDMVILLFFTYFICSVLLSVLVEMGATLLNLRANELEKTLKNLFFHPGWNAYLTQHILGSPFFDALKKSNDPKGKPSYLPAENFAKAILESLRTGTSPLTIASIQANIAILPADLQKIVLGYIDTANNKIEDLQKQLEGFYDSAMIRAGGWYKKKIRPISIVLAALLVIVLNIDTIEIIQKSTKNPTQLAEAVNEIQNQMPQIQKDSSSQNYIFKDKKGNEIATTKADSAFEKQVKVFSDLKEELNNNVFTIGYKSWKDVCNKWTHNKGFSWSAFGYILLKLLGLFLSVLALQVGSTYWFDTLNKVINLRGSGKKPEEKPQNQ